MEKYLNVLSFKINKGITRGFILCFPILRFLVALCNAILAFIGGIVLSAALIMYIVPKFHTFLDALKHIFNVHTIFGAAIVLGALTMGIGISGLYFLNKGYYDKLGLQAAAFLILLIVMSALTFTFWMEWESNAHFGISYATQSFNPRDKHGTYFKSIQEFMLCCGSSGPGDYDIGNEYFKYATAPLCCCDHVNFPTFCLENQKKVDNGTLPLAISVHKAFKVGCMTKMEKVIWPIIIYIIFIKSGFCFLCMVLSAVLIIGFQSYIKPKCTHKKKNEEKESSEHEYEESIKLKG